MNRIRRLIAVTMCTGLLAACGGDDNDGVASAVAADSAAPKSVVAVAQSDAQFSVLVEAVVAAGLVDTLNGAGPFTVFAPTNDAFVKLLGELGVTKEQLLADKPLLTKVLTNHVVPGLVKKADVPLGTAIATLEGSTFSVDAALTIKDQCNRSAKIVATDVAASNGVVHVIDTVLLPTDAGTIVGVAAGAPELSILVEAVTAAGLIDTLNGLGPFTVFAPTNDAFASLLAELHVTKEALLADKALLTQVLAYHVVPGKVMAADVPIDTPIKTVQGSSFTVNAHLNIVDGRHRLAAITATDIAASNGVVHLIDKVILPPQ